MKIIEYVRLGACAICPYSDKKQNKKLKCHWDNYNPDFCVKVKVCRNFPDVKENIAKLVI